MSKAVPTPLYISIRHYVLNLIYESSGKETKIKSERELSRIFNANRLTVRKALKQLIDEGQLIAKAGQGTFINPNSPLLKNNMMQYRPAVRVGLIVSSGDLANLNRYFWEMISSAGDIITAKGAFVDIIQLNPADNPFAQIQSTRVEGILWFNPQAMFAKVVLELEDKGIPVVCVNPGFDADVDKRYQYARVDYYHEGSMGAEKMLALSKKGLIYAAAAEKGQTGDIFQGFMAKMTKEKIPLTKIIRISCEEDIVTRLNSIFQKSDPVNVVFCPGRVVPLLDIVLEKFKKKVPDDLQLICTDGYSLVFCSNIKQAYVLKEPLSSLAKSAVRHLLNRIFKKETRKLRKRLKPNLKIEDCLKRKAI